MAAQLSVPGNHHSSHPWRGKNKIIRVHIKKMIPKNADLTGFGSVKLQEENRIQNHGLDWVICNFSFVLSTLATEYYLDS